MKTFLLVSILLISSMVTAQQKVYSGTIEGSLFNDDLRRMNKQDTIYFTQGNKVFTATTVVGKFYLDFEYRLEEPFTVHFTNPDCVRKTVYFDLSDALNDSDVLEGESLIQFPAIKLNMVPFKEEGVIETTVARFQWNTDRLLLDLQHSKDQSDFMDDYQFKSDSIHSDSTFNLSSQNFKIGDLYRPESPIAFTKKKAVLEEGSTVELDRIVDFLKNHPNMIIEVGTYLASSTKEKSNSSLDEARADAIVAYFESNGVHQDQLIALGYGKGNPIISDERINSMKSKKDREAAHLINSRTEFIILSLTRRLEL